MSDKKIITGVKHKSDRTLLSFFPKRQRISADENNNSWTDPIQIANPAEADVSENGKPQEVGGGRILIKLRQKDCFCPRGSGTFPG